MTKQKTLNQALALFGALGLSISTAFAQTESKPAKTETIVSPAPSSTPATSPTPDSPSVSTTAAAASKSRVEVPPEKAAPLRIPRLDKPPVIDGKLNEDVWKQAVVLKDFYQINPGDNTTPSAPTEVLLGYDSRFLYFAVHALDDPTKVRASIARRDNVFGEDNIRLLLDTFNDQRKAYVLGWNPLGVQQDGIMTEGGNTDFSVDIVMERRASSPRMAGLWRLPFHLSLCATKPARTSCGAFKFGETLIALMTNSIRGYPSAETCRDC